MHRAVVVMAEPLTPERFALRYEHTVAATVRYVARKYRLSTTVAEDVVQEAFMEVYGHLGREVTDDWFARAIGLSIGHALRKYWKAGPVEGINLDRLPAGGTPPDVRAMARQEYARLPPNAQGAVARRALGGTITPGERVLLSRQRRARRRQK